MKAGKCLLIRSLKVQKVSGIWRYLIKIGVYQLHDENILHFINNITYSWHKINNYIFWLMVFLVIYGRGIFELSNYSVSGSWIYIFWKKIWSCHLLRTWPRRLRIPATVLVLRVHLILSFKSQYVCQLKTPERSFNLRCYDIKSHHVT